MNYRRITSTVRSPATRLHPWAVLGALLTAASGPASASDPAALPLTPRNIIVIVADDVGVDLIGAYEPYFANHPNPAYPNTTPAIDSLAATGMTFRNAWTDPVCSPSRAQLLTGRHAHRSGVATVFTPADDERLGLQPHVETIPSLLRSSHTPFPYVTAAIGKWHLADPNQHGRELPAHPLGTSAMPWFHLFAGSIDNLNGQSFNQWQKTFGTIIDHGQDECVPTSGFSCKATVVDYATKDTADDAIHLIETLPEPFFLYVAFNAVHLPLGAPQTPLQPASCLGGAVQGVTVCNAPFDGTDVPLDTRCMMQWLDNEVGRILCATEGSSSSPDSPTTILFTSDNGTRGAKTNFKDGAIVPPFNMKHGKSTLYEGGVHVPLIVRSPVIPPSLRGSSHEALVQSTDLFATVAELANAAPLTDRFQVRDSISFVPHLLGTPGSQRSFAYAEMFHQNYVPDAAGHPPAGFTLALQRRAIRDVAGRKLIQVVKPDGQGGFLYDEELYDLANDPHEANDLIPLIGQAPYSGWHAALRSELDGRYPHLVTP